MIERVPVLTIAGSDSCGGAGIQADLKTMTALYVYGMSAITALTAQNTLGVQGILPVSADFLGQQLDAICTDIPPEAVKIGMIASPEQVDIICAKIQQYHLKKVVVDPVMVATTGAELTERTTVDAMRGQLFAQADLLTQTSRKQRFCSEKLFRRWKKCRQLQNSLRNSIRQRFWSRAVT